MYYDHTVLRELLRKSKEPMTRATEIRTYAKAGLSEQSIAQLTKAKLQEVRRVLARTTKPGRPPKPQTLEQQLKAIERIAEQSVRGDVKFACRELQILLPREHLDATPPVSGSNEGGGSGSNEGGGTP